MGLLGCLVDYLDEEEFGGFLTFIRRQWVQELWKSKRFLSSVSTESRALYDLPLS